MTEPSPGKRVYRASPVGVAVYPWINKPDTKFNADGVFKTSLAPVDPKEAEAFRTEIDKLAQEAFERETAKMTPAERKKWSVYAPYEVEEDEEGKPTGRILFSFRQNAVIKLQDGSTKGIRIGIYDSADRPTEAEIWGGAQLRIKFCPRDVKVASTKKAGVRLDFLKVQVIQLAQRDDKGGFGGVEGGYVGDEPGESYAPDEGGEAGDGEF